MTPATVRVYQRILELYDSVYRDNPTGLPLSDWYRVCCENERQDDPFPGCATCRTVCAVSFLFENYLYCNRKKELNALHHEVVDNQKVTKRYLRDTDYQEHTRLTNASPSETVDYVHSVGKNSAWEELERDLLSQNVLKKEKASILVMGIILLEIMRQLELQSPTDDDFKLIAELCLWDREFFQCVYKYYVHRIITGSPKELVTQFNTFATILDLVLEKNQSRDEAEVLQRRFQDEYRKVLKHVSTANQREVRQTVCKFIKDRLVYDSSSAFTLMCINEEQQRILSWFLRYRKLRTVSVKMSEWYRNRAIRKIRKIDRRTQ